MSKIETWIWRIAMPLIFAGMAYATWAVYARYGFWLGTANVVCQFALGYMSAPFLEMMLPPTKPKANDPQSDQRQAEPPVPPETAKDGIG
jgi:hypothetical protein